MISRLSTVGKTPPIKRAARGMPYGWLFIIISRTTGLRPDSNCLMVNQGLTPQFDALAPVVQQIMISHYATRGMEHI